MRQPDAGRAVSTGMAARMGKHGTRAFLFAVGLSMALVTPSLCYRWSAWSQGPFRPLFVESIGETVEYGARTALFVHRMPRPFGLDIPSPGLGTVESAFKRAPGAPAPGTLGAPGTLAEPMDWWPDPGPDATEWGVNRFRVGFPFPAFEFSQHGWQNTDGIRHSRSVGIVEFGRVPMFGWIAVPLRPVWPGLLLNWLAWTAFVWLLWRLVGDRVRMRRAKRRRDRIERGVCVACGYDLAGLGTCPECGAVTPPASSCV